MFNMSSSSTRKQKKEKTLDATAAGNIVPTADLTTTSALEGQEAEPEPRRTLKMKMRINLWT